MRYAVIGAGHGGQTIAAYLTMLGHPVSLFNRTATVIEAIRANGGIELQGLNSGKFTIDRMSDDMGAVVQGSDVILVTTSADAHYSIANMMAPYLQGNETIILIPGRTGGTFEFMNVLRSYGKDREIVVGETDTFVYTCRSLQPGVCKIFGKKLEVLFSTYRVADIEPTIEQLKPIFPMLTPVTSVWHTGLSNIGIIFHPTPIILNIARIEYQEDFLHYHNAISPMICRYLECLDRERLAVASQLGLQVKSALRWLADVYDVRGASLYEAIQRTDCYREVTAPKNVITRYVFEDISTGLVPISCLGDHLQVPTPAMKHIVAVASILYDYDFMANGRNMERMAFADLLRQPDEACGQVTSIP